jgi:hypothetical protein
MINQLVKNLCVFMMTWNGFRISWLHAFFLGGMAYLPDVAPSLHDGSLWLYHSEQDDEMIEASLPHVQSTHSYLTAQSSTSRNHQAQDENSLSLKKFATDTEWLNLGGSSSLPIGGFAIPSGPPAKTAQGKDLKNQHPFQPGKALCKSLVNVPFSTC